MRKAVRYFSILSTAIMLTVGCAGTVVVRKAPPPPQVDIRPTRPGPKAVWIDGHWKWNGHKYSWLSGHWERNPRGTWVAGHWKKTPRGHVWVKGHWKR